MTALVFQESGVHIPRKYSFLGDCGQPTGVDATVVCPFLPLLVVYFGPQNEGGVIC